MRPLLALLLALASPALAGPVHCLTCEEKSPGRCSSSTVANAPEGDGPRVSGRLRLYYSNE